MKINIFNTQCRIGSKVRYKSKIREVYDINRITYELCLSRNAAFRSHQGMRTLSPKGQNADQQHGPPNGRIQQTNMPDRRCKRGSHGPHYAEHGGRYQASYRSLWIYRQPGIA